MDFLTLLEDNAFAAYLRESLFAYPLLLTAHALGMGFIVGINAAISLRILGFAPGLPLAPMKKFFPLMWIGFWVNAISGFVLLFAFATKNFTDPVFYAKLGFIGLAVVNLRLIGRTSFHNPAPAGTNPWNPKALAAASLVFWAGAILTGRFMAYQFFRFWEH